MNVKKNLLFCALLAKAFMAHAGDETLELCPVPVGLQEQEVSPGKPTVQESQKQQKPEIKSPEIKSLDPAVVERMQKIIKQEADVIVADLAVLVKDFYVATIKVVVQALNKERADQLKKAIEASVQLLKNLTIGGKDIKIDEALNVFNKVVDKFGPFHDAFNQVFDELSKREALKQETGKKLLRETLRALEAAVADQNIWKQVQ